MPPLLKFLIRRLIPIPITLVIITAALYGVAMAAPLDMRVSLYWPKRTRSDMTPEQIQSLTNKIIRDHGLNDPFPVQYARWAVNLMKGDWGWSPSMNAEVLPALLVRTPVTAELTLYSVVMLIPLGLISGVLAGAKPNRLADHGFRLTAFIATSFPSFILALMLMAVFYVGLRWFPPERLGLLNDQVVKSAEFKRLTGLLTLDGFLNRRPDISLDAVRHLVLPVITLSLAHWATLGRVTRAAMIETLDAPYIIAARARGVPNRRIVWRHALRNAFSPALTASALSAASLVTGVFVVEAIYNFHGVSEVITTAITFVPDAPMALGFAIYSVLVVLMLMLSLDLLQAFADPRIREGNT